MATRTQKIEAARAKMKVGQIKMVIVGPGRRGRVLIRKGKPSGGPTLLKNIGKQKSKAKVITRKKR